MITGREERKILTVFLLQPEECRPRVSVPALSEGVKAMSFWKRIFLKIIKILSLRAAGKFRRTLPSCLQASMTVEAAFVLPLFIFCMAQVLYVFDMIRLQSNMTAALHEAGTQLSEYSFYYRYGLSDVLDMQAGDSTYEGETGADAGLAEIIGSAALSETWVRSSTVSYLGKEYLDGTCLEGGAGSISYLQSSILAGTDEIDLIADYRIKPFLALLRPF